MADIASEVTSSAPSSQADPVSSFSFGNLHEQAMNFDASSDASTSTPPTGEQAAVVAEPSAQEHTEAAQNVDNASQSQLAQLKDTDMVEVTVDGQPVQMPWSQAKGGVMRQAHYTREMQSLRQREQQFTQQQEQVNRLAQEHQALTTLLSNKELLGQFLQAKYPDLVQQAQQAQAAVDAAQTSGDPNDIATLADLQRMQAAAEQRLVKMAEALGQQLDEGRVTIAREIEDRSATLRLANDINTTIKGLFSEHPHLQKLIPDAEQVLRYNVMKMQPKTPQETLEAFKTVFGGWVEQYNASVAETSKSKIVAKQKMLSNNIQPPGGAGVQPQPTSFEKVNKISGKRELDWNKIHDAAMNF